MQRKGWQTEGVSQVGAELEEEVEKPKHWQHISFRYCVGTCTVLYGKNMYLYVNPVNPVPAGTCTSALILYL